MQNDDDFDAIQRIQPDPIVAEEVSIVANVGGLKILKIEVLHQQPLQFLFDAVQRSIGHTQSNSLTNGSNWKILRVW